MNTPEDHTQRSSAPGTHGALDDVGRAAERSRDATGSGIDAWLHALGHMLSMPLERRREIVAELEAHLHERVRDLMLEGLDEARATHQAIGELGDAAVVAGRFRKVEGSLTRRLMMNGLLIGTTAAAVGLCVIGFQAATPTPASAPAASALSGSDRAPNLVEAGQAQSGVASADAASITLDASDTLETFVTKFASSFGKPAFVYWDRLRLQQIEPGTTFHLPTGTMPRLEAWRLVNDALPGGQSPLGWRLGSDRLEVSLQEHLDRREIELAVYDLSSILEDRSSEWGAVTMRNAVDLVRFSIEPRYWEPDGLATIHVVGDRVFVRAPRRVQAQVNWIMQAVTGSQQGSLSLDDPNPAARRRSADDARRDTHVDLIRSELVRIDGAIERGGFFQCPPNDRLTLKRLVAAAGGLRPDAKRVTITRMSSDEQVSTTDVAASDLLKSDTPDFDLVAGDVVHVE